MNTEGEKRKSQRTANTRNDSKSVGGILEYTILYWTLLRNCHLWNYFDPYSHSGLRALEGNATSISERKTSKAPARSRSLTRDIRALRTARADSGSRRRPRERERAAPFNPTRPHRYRRPHPPQPIRSTPCSRSAHPSHAIGTDLRTTAVLRPVPARATRLDERPVTAGEVSLLNQYPRTPHSPCSNIAFRSGFETREGHSHTNPR